MSKEFSFRYPLSNGLHARPASHLVEAIGRFNSEVTFLNTRNGNVANARSVLALVATDTRFEDWCEVRVTGSDEIVALGALENYLSGEFTRCDEPLVEVRPLSVDTVVPRSLLAAKPGRFLIGKVACGGIGEGLLVVARALPRSESVSALAQVDIAHERETFSRALMELRVDYAKSVRASRGAAADVLRAHLSVLNDPAFLEKIEQGLAAQLSATDSVTKAINSYVQLFGNAESFYIRERVLDLEDIGMQLLDRISGKVTGTQAFLLKEPSVLVVDRLTPRQLLSLDRSNLRGLVLGQAGQTSHTVILARSFNIPTLTGVAQSGLTTLVGARAIVDAQTGVFIPQASADVLEYYVGERRKLASIAKKIDGLRAQLGRTLDGRKLELGANIASGEEAALAFAQGAEGIGLFRTELLFADREQAPAEEEQYLAYAAAVRAAAGRAVIIRTLDIGGDKPVPFLPLPEENNPFLGNRGVRLYEKHRDLIITQLRAIWRAAQHGPVKVLVPMISTVEEARATKEQLLAARDELLKEGTTIGSDVTFGLMLEVPSVAFIMDELSAVADFFSVGTNDLTQYFLAADRENEGVAQLYSPFHPAFLRLLRQIVAGARAHGRWIGLCGEMAENAAALPLLVALGFDEISVAAPRLASVKSALSRLKGDECDDVFARALKCASREEVERTLARGQRQAEPMLTPALVLTDLECSTKEQVIRALVNALEIEGRTLRPSLVEEAVWLREEAYSTGFGDGFALPHCKTDEVSDNTIVIARLKQPVPWQALDGKPVDVAILLVIRKNDHAREHMRSLARLSRLMTDEKFRSKVRDAGTAEELTALVLNQVGVSHQQIPI